MLNSKRFIGYLATGIIPDMTALDESLAEHDKKHHPNGYKEGDSCNKREEMAKKDDQKITNGKIDDWSKIDLTKDVDDWIDKDGYYLVSNEFGGLVSGSGQWGMGISTLRPGISGWQEMAMRFNTPADAEKFVRDHYGLAIGAPLSSRYTLMHGLPNLEKNKVWNDPKNHWTYAEKHDGDSGYGPLPGSAS